jgi:hypothetical protein
MRLEERRGGEAPQQKQNYLGGLDDALNDAVLLLGAQHTKLECLNTRHSGGNGLRVHARTLCRNSCRFSRTCRFCSFWTRSSKRSHLSFGIWAHNLGTRE